MKNKFEKNIMALFNDMKSNLGNKVLFDNIKSNFVGVLSFRHNGENYVIISVKRHVDRIGFIYQNDRYYYMNNNNIIVRGEIKKFVKHLQCYENDYEFSNDLDDMLFVDKKIDAEFSLANPSIVNTYFSNFNSDIDDYLFKCEIPLNVLENFDIKNNGKTVVIKNDAFKSKNVNSEYVINNAIRIDKFIYCQNGVNTNNILNILDNVTKNVSNNQVNSKTRLWAIELRDLLNDMINTSTRNKVDINMNDLKNVLIKKVKEIKF